VSDLKWFFVPLALFNGCLSAAVAVLYSYEGKTAIAIVWGFTGVVWIINAAGTWVGWERPWKRRSVP
jgi:hypothetical protein